MHISDMNNNFRQACTKMLASFISTSVSQDHILIYHKERYLTSSTKNFLPDGCLPFPQYLLPPSADPHLHCHKLFPLRHMSKALLKSRQIISTMFCLENEFSLHADIKVAWKIYLWYICVAFYSIFLLSHDFKYFLLKFYKTLNTSEIKLTALRLS